MADIVQFPTSLELTEGAVRKALRLAGATPEMINWIWTDFEPRLYRANGGNYKFLAPDECMPVLNQAIKFFQGQLGAAAGEMLALEMELYYAKFGGTPLDSRKARLSIVPPSEPDSVE